MDEDSIRNQLTQLRCIRCCKVVAKQDMEAKLAGWCRGCRVTFYCSNKCQKKDWKHHKVLCHSDKANIVTVKSQGHEREHRLFRQFHNQVDATMLYPYFVLTAFNSGGHAGRALLLQQPPTKMARLALTFDYNARSFSPSFYSTFCDLYETAAAIGHTDYMDGGDDQLQHWLQVNVMNTSIIHNMRVTISKSQIESATRDLCEDALRISLLCRLTSSIFADWDAVLDKVHGEAVDFLATAHSQDFLSFAMHALRCKSHVPLYKTHVILLEVTTGFALGHLMSLDHFMVLTLDEVVNFWSTVDTQVIDTDQMLRQETDGRNNTVKFRFVLNAFPDLATTHVFDATSFWNEEKGKDKIKQDREKENKLRRRGKKKRKNQKKQDRTCFTSANDSDAAATRLFEDKLIKIRGFPEGERPTIG